MALSKGDFVKWTCPIDTLIRQDKSAKGNPDCLLIMDVESNKAKVVLGWHNAHKYMTRVFTNKGAVYVLANNYLTLEVNSLELVADLKLINLSSLEYVSRKHNEILVKKQAKAEERKQRKISKAEKKKLAEQRERARAVERKYAKLKKRLSSPSPDAWKYEMAVINNDQKTMKAIIKKVGYDPRPKAGCKSGSTLKRVTNPRPCVGGLVNPK